MITVKFKRIFRSISKYRYRANWIVSPIPCSVQTTIVSLQDFNSSSVEIIKPEEGKQDWGTCSV